MVPLFLLQSAMVGGLSRPTLMSQRYEREMQVDAGTVEKRQLMRAHVLIIMFRSRRKAAKSLQFFLIVRDIRSFSREQVDGTTGSDG